MMTPRALRSLILTLLFTILAGLVVIWATLAYGTRPAPTQHQHQHQHQHQR